MAQEAVDRDPQRDVFVAALARALLKEGPPNQSSHDYEDAVMAYILRLLEQESELSPPVRGTLAKYYAIRAVQNALINEFRRRQRLSLTPDLDLHPARATPSSGGAPRLIEMIRERIDKEDMELLLAYFGGQDAFRNECLARELSPGTARVRVHRLVQRLRALGGVERGGQADDFDNHSR